MVFNMLLNNNYTDGNEFSTFVKKGSGVIQLLFQMMEKLIFLSEKILKYLLKLHFFCVWGGGLRTPTPPLKSAFGFHESSMKVGLRPTWTQGPRWSQNQTAPGATVELYGLRMGLFALKLGQCEPEAIPGPLSPGPPKNP